MTDFDARSARNSGGSLYDALYNQRGIVALVVATGFILALAIVLVAKPKYAATATILMVPEPPGTLAQGPQSAAKPVLAQDLPALVTSETVLGRFRKDIGESEPFDALRTRIHAKVASDSNIMPVQYTDHTTDGAVRGANALAGEVEAFYRELATKRFDSLSADLARQTAQHAKNLARLDAELQATAKQYPYDDVSASVQQSVYQRLITLRSERDEVLSTVAADQSTALGTRLLIADARPPAMRDIVDNDAPYRALRDQYARDLAQLQRIESYGSAAYPGLRELRDMVAREGADLATARVRAAAAGPGANLAYATARDAVAKADAQLQSDTSKVAVLDAQIHDLNAQIAQGGIATRVSGIRRDRDNEETAYSTLATRLASTIADRAEAASTGSVTVVDPASYASRVVFTTGTYLATAVIFLTFWAAVSLALLLENKKGRVEETEDVIRGIYGAPLLGSI